MCELNKKYTGFELITANVEKVQTKYKQINSLFCFGFFSYQRLKKAWLKEILTDLLYNFKIDCLIL